MPGLRPTPLPLLCAAALLGAAAAPACALAQPVVHERVTRAALPDGGTALRVRHIDTRTFGQPSASYAGAARAHGALTDPALRADAHDAPLARASAPSADAQATGSAPAPATSWCGTERSTDDVADQRSTLPRYKVIYARPSDAPDRFSTYADLMQQAPTWAANTIAAGASGLRAPRFDYGTSCGAAYVDVASIVLPRTTTAYQAMTIDARADALQADLDAALPSLGLAGSSPWNELVFADRVSPPSDPRSVGFLYMDDSPGPTNANAQGGLAAFIMGSGGDSFVGNGAQDYLAYSVTHELGHTLGAVQDGAPHSTGYGHCTDGYAIMCYDDGGPDASQYTTSACSAPLGSYAGSYAGVTFDCGSNDYLSSAPPLGSWLAAHWNTFDSPFMCDTNSCTSSTVAPVATLQASATRVPAGTTVTLDASGSHDPDGLVADYRFDLDGDGTFETDRGVHATASLRRDAAASVTAGVQVTDNDGLTSQATVTVAFSDRAPVARVTGPSGATVGVPVTLDASASSDPDAGDALSYSWTDDDGRWLGTAPTATYTPPSGGTHVVTVTVRDHAGASASASWSLAVAGAAREGGTPVPTDTGTPALTPGVTPSPAGDAAPGSSTPSPPAGSTASRAGTVRAVRVRALAHGRVEVRLRCPATGRAGRGRVDVTVAGARTRVRATLAAGTSRTLRVRPRRAAHGRRAGVRVYAGTHRVSSRTLRLR